MYYPSGFNIAPPDAVNFSQSKYFFPFDRTLKVSIFVAHCTGNTTNAEVQKEKVAKFIIYFIRIRKCFALIV